MPVKLVRWCTAPQVPPVGVLFSLVCPTHDLCSAASNGITFGPSRSITREASYSAVDPILQQRIDPAQARSPKITNRAEHVRAPSSVSSVAPGQQGRPLVRVPTAIVDKEN